MFGRKEPDTEKITRDLVTQELPHLAFDATLITGLNATSNLCFLDFDDGGIGHGKRKMEFFFGDRIR